jgi:hypothetical protein
MKDYAANVNRYSRMKTIISILAICFSLTASFGQCGSYEAFSVQKQKNKPDLAYFQNARFVYEKDSVFIMIDTTESNTSLAKINQESPFYLYKVDTNQPRFIKAVYCPKADTTFRFDQRVSIDNLSRNENTLCFVSSPKRKPKLTVIDCKAGTKTTIKTDDKVSLKWVGTDDKYHYYTCQKLIKGNPEIVYIIKASTKGIEKLDYKHADDYELCRYTSNYQVYYKKENADCGLLIFNTKVFYNNVEIDQFNYVSRHNPQFHLSKDGLKISWYMEYERYYESGKYSHVSDLVNISKNTRINNTNPDYILSDSLYTYAIYTFDTSQNFGLKTIDGQLQTANGLPLQKESEEYQIIAIFKNSDLQFLYFPRIEIEN